MSRTTRVRLSGFTIVEVVVGISVLVLGMIASITLANHLLRSTSTTRGQLVIVNIAREGIEAARNIRDSNWQRNSGSQRDATADTRDHWDDQFKTTAPTPAGALYIPRLVALTDLASPPYDADLGNAVWLPSTWVLSTAASPTAPVTQLFTDPDTDRLVHVENPAAPGAFAPTRFSRVLRVRYLDDAGTPTNDTDARRIHVEATVTEYPTDNPADWATATPVRTVTLATTLADWYGRKSK